MADITFTSPAMKKDLTVYVVAGNRTLLAVAKTHRVPLHHECENGECGSCAVQVTVLARGKPLGAHLTEKEKAVLRLAGKIGKEEIEDAELRDLPPRWRLACQYVVRDEDILVAM
jgi:ferredoxin